VCVCLCLCVGVFLVSWLCHVAICISDVCVVCKYLCMLVRVCYVMCACVSMLEKEQTEQNTDGVGGEWNVRVREERGGEGRVRGRVRRSSHLNTVCVCLCVCM
jgi:hypothetical protein